MLQAFEAEQYMYLQARFVYAAIFSTVPRYFLADRSWLGVLGDTWAITRWAGLGMVSAGSTWPMSHHDNPWESFKHSLSRAQNQNRSTFKAHE